MMRGVLEKRRSETDKRRRWNHVGGERQGLKRGM